MDKKIRAMLFAAAGASVLLTGLDYGFCDDEIEGGGQEQMPAPQEDARGMDNAGRKRDAFDNWNRYFRGDLPDPLAESNMTSEEFQRRQELTAKRTQAGAEFVNAAGTLVSALPTDPAAAVAGGMAVSETANAVVENQTTAPAEKPGVLSRIWTWIKSWF